MDQLLRQKIYNEIVTIECKKKISCSKAHQISSELNVSLKKIGEICNEEGIKISQCQLGCF